MPKDGSRNGSESGNGSRRHRHRDHHRSHCRRRNTSPRTRDSLGISQEEYTLVIESCQEMLTNIRSQIDQLCDEYRDKDDIHKEIQPSTTDLYGVSSSSTSSSSRHGRASNNLSGLGSIRGQSSTSSARRGLESGDDDDEQSAMSSLLPRLPPLHNLDKSKKSPSKKNIDNLVKLLEGLSKLNTSVTKQSIDKVMSVSSTCQLQLLEVSLQCPLSQAKIKVPCKTTTCQHLGCFDAKTFLSIMMGTSKPTWKCPICSASATWSELVVDSFLQEIINTTPEEAMKIEFTSSSIWRIKKETGTPISGKTKSRQIIDLTESPQPIKSTFIDLTHSP